MSILIILVSVYVAIWIVEPFLEHIFNIDRYTTTFLFSPINAIYSIYCEIRATSYLDNYQPEKAHYFYERILHYYPKNPIVISNIGLGYMRFGDYYRAMKAQEKAIELDPSHPLFYSNLAGCHVCLGEYEEALTQYQKAITRNPHHCMSYAGLSLTYTHLGNYQEALVAVNQGIANFDHEKGIYSHNWNIIKANLYNQRAITYVLLERYGEALADALQTCKLRPTDKEFLATLAVVYYQLNRFDQSLDSWNRVVTIDAKYEDATTLEQEYHPSPAFMELAHEVAHVWAKTTN